VSAVENHHVDQQHRDGRSLSMSRLKWMTAITVSGLMVVAGAAAWAQDEDRDSCVDACQQAKEQCVEICDTHSNPVECDEDCQDTAHDCIRECR
jgi:hypothetical protein